MATAKDVDTNEDVIVGAPPVADDPDTVKPGPGQIMVESPTGARTIIADYAWGKALESQGYKKV